jgi:hypothetical protein
MEGEERGVERKRMKRNKKGKTRRILAEWNLNLGSRKKMYKKKRKTFPLHFLFYFSLIMQLKFE